MPRKFTQNSEELDTEKMVQASNAQQNNNQQTKEEVDKLTRMLASVLEYLSDEDTDEIDIGYIFDNTEGLKEWWNQYKEKNRKVIEEEIKQSLGELSLEDLNKILKQLKEKQN
ncbi:hypothetical protein MKY04_02490 [Lysinibacillus telephonicus]|uniref:hypothetical protein n=1 Tax=Lysinibacillus telephonicus TaxID=1714840 RepID=UPI0031FC2C5B